MTHIDPRTPVLVGFAAVEQREDDPTRAREAVRLMSDAALAAGRDAGSDALLAGVQRIYVPQGLWSYPDPGRLIANAINAPDATSVLARIGILQQTPIGDACRRIAAGELDVALVAGGEAKYRALRAQIGGVEVGETAQECVPDEVMEPAAELMREIELDVLGPMPVAYYAVLESAWRAARGLGVEAHRDHMAAMYSRFSEIAAANPHAWKRLRLDAATIRNPGPNNPMLAFPYTRLHNTSWNVDQAAALIFCSAARAEALGIDRERWLFPLASTESNDMQSVTERAELHACPGARIAGRRALELAGIDTAGLDIVDLYSCFPVAVETYADALGLAESVDLTVTGGMPFAGGPLNNYVLQATCRAAELLREHGDGTALVSSVSGLLTKQGFGLYGRCAPGRPFAFDDVSDAVRREAPPREVVDDADGEGRIAGYTVLYRDRAPWRVAAVIDFADNRRTLAACDDAALVAAAEHDELCGRTVTVAGRSFGLR